MSHATPASPCNNICRMDPDTGNCLGCFRNLDEIARWSRATDGEKIAILAQLPGRKTGRPPSGDGR